MNPAMRHAAGVSAAIAVAIVSATVAAQAQSQSQSQACPAPLAAARRLVLVTAKTMTDIAAEMRLYERASPAEPWRASGPSEPATVGKAGIGWAHFFPRHRRANEAIKVQGDKRG